MSALKKGDVVAVRDRDLGQLARLYPWLSALDTLVVTREDRSTGKRRLFMRKVGAEHHVLVAWPASLKLIRRAPAAPRRRS